MAFRKWKQLALLLFITWLWINATPLCAYLLPISFLNGYPKLEVNGNNTISFNLNQVSGSRTSFQDDNFGQSSTFTESSNLHLSGDLLKNLALDATYLADRTAPAQLTWRLRYNTQNATYIFGDFTGHITGNDFALLNRSLFGMEVDAKLPKGTFTALTSTLEAPVHTDTFYGNNTSGPYYLTTTPLVESSELVMVNNVKKVRGTDYTLEYTSGTLNFTAGILIAPADQVVVSYEVQENGLGGGKLYAVRGTYPVLRNLQIGVTRLDLIASGQASTNVAKTDQLLGDSTPGPFYLTFRPVVSGSELVLINGVLQARNTAYTLDYTTGRLLFSNGYAPPYGTTVIINYQVIEQGASGADRAVTGLDMDWQALHGLTFNMQTAQSSGNPTAVSTPAQQISSEPVSPELGISLTQQTFTLKHLPVQPGSEKIIGTTLSSSANQLVNGVDYTLNYLTGQLHLLRDNIVISPLGPTFLVSYTTRAVTARLQGDNAVSYGASFNMGKVQATARYRQVDPGFTPIETVGYRTITNELDLTGHVALTKNLAFSMTDSDSTLPYNPYAASTPAQIMMREQDQSYALDFNKQYLPSVSLHHTTQNSTQLNNGALGDDSTTDSVNLGYTYKAITANCNLNRVKTDSIQLIDSSTASATGSSTTNSTYHYQGTTDNKSVSLNFQPGERLNLGINMAENTITLVSDGATASSSGNNLVWTAMFKPFKTITLNAGMQTSNTDATTAANGSAVPAQSTRNLLLGAIWQSSKRLTVMTNFARNSAQGGENSDCKTDTVTINTRWLPKEWTKFDGYWSEQSLRYLDTVGSSQSNLLGANAQLGPITALHKSTFDVGIQHLWGNTTTGVSNLSKTEGQAMCAITTRLDNVGTTVTGNNLTTLSGKITIPITRRYDIFFATVDTRNGGFPNQSQKDTYTIGWNYHLDKTFTFTLDAGRVIYRDRTAAALNYSANQMNAQLSWTL